MIRFTAHRHKVESMDFFPDSSHLVTVGGSSKAIWIWDLRNPGKPQKYFPQNPEEYGSIVPVTRQVAVSSKNEILFSTQRDIADVNGIWCFLNIVSWPDKVVRRLPIQRVQNLRTARQRQCVVFEHQSPIWADIADPQDWHSFRFEEYENVPKGWEYLQAFNSDDLSHFLGLRALHIAIFERSAKKCIKVVPYSGHWFIRGCFSSLNRYFVVAGHDEFSVFEFDSPQPITFLTNAKKDPATPCFTPDERYILFGREGVLHVVDIQTGEEVRCYDFGLHKITTMKISDDGLMVALAGANQSMVVVDLDL